jgi:hypothetical protein
MSIADEIKKLDKLRCEGILTEQEFASQKEKLLSPEAQKSKVLANKDPTLYDVPVRLESESQGSNDNSGAQVNSIGVALAGGICPSCSNSDYLKTYTVWHGVLALCFFPIGLCAFLLPVKKCVGCQHDYGAGKELSTVTAWTCCFMFVVSSFIVIVLSLQ